MKRNNDYISEKFKVYRVSEFINQHDVFVKVVSKAYSIIDDVSIFYPNYFKWYWEKVVPNILKGTRDVIIVIVNYEIVGVAIVKKEENEKKLCTIFVKEEYRYKQITIRLLEECFSFLETNTPLVTISEEKMYMFEGIIKKYKWNKTQVLPKEYYNNICREIVFNGFIN